MDFNDEMQGLVDLDNTYNLNKKSHIKKYFKIDDLYCEIYNSMVNYANIHNYTFEETSNFLEEYIAKEFKDLFLTIKISDLNKQFIFQELFIYKNIEGITSITEEYINTNKFKSKNKIKLLDSMNNSYASLFKIIDYDRNNGYVTYEDVFSKKTYKIIDIVTSSLEGVYKKFDVYVYNRIITYEDISFTTNLPIVIEGSSKRLKEFINNPESKNYNNLTKCLLLYDIFKNDNKFMGSDFS